MSHVIKAVLSSAQHPGNGQIRISFPIPNQEYDRTMEALEVLGCGDALKQDCRMDELDSFYTVLDCLEGMAVNVDQLDYLAKRLDSFCTGEDAQFQAMAHKLELTQIKDFINLTFCCQQATVITDFFDLTRIGKAHAMTLNGGSMPMDQYQAVDGRKEALQLIEGGEGTVTPFGVAYDNGMELEQCYNGHQFPAYLYDNFLMVFEITPKRGLAEGENPEYLYLPAAEHQIERTLLRIGISTPFDARVRLSSDKLPEKVADGLDLDSLSGNDLPSLNRMCQAIAPLKDAEVKKLNAAVLMTEASDITAICQLAENLDQFDFIPGIQTPEEYGRYVIQESGQFEYNKILEDFYDYRFYGEQCIRQEGGQFNECGYVAYHGTLALEELMRDDPAEVYQRDQEIQMGGMS